MAQLRPAEVNDIEAICAFLSENMHRGMRADQYRQLFDYAWMPDKSGRGFVLLEGERIVGFLGAIYSDRIIQGRVQRFCNLTNWCVLPDFRNESMKLLFAIGADSRQTVVNLSPSKEAQRIFGAMRYRVLDTYKLFGFPLAHFWTLFNRCKIIFDQARIEGMLSESDLAIMRDHADTGCRFALIADRSSQCFIVTKKRRKQHVPFTEVLYASHPALLRRSFESIKLPLLIRDRTAFLAVDERLIGARLPFMLPYARVSLFRSPAVEPPQIDNLYSELALL